MGTPVSPSACGVHSKKYSTHCTTTMPQLTTAKVMKRRIDANTLYRKNSTA